MKTLVLLALVGMTTSGCLTSKLDKTVAALAKDNASAHVRVTSIYGVIEYTRSNPGANTLPHTLGPDGDIKVTESTRAGAQKTAPAPVTLAAAPVAQPAPRTVSPQAIPRVDVPKPKAKPVAKAAPAPKAKAAPHVTTTDALAKKKRRLPGDSATPPAK